jgi:hypothetical protein
MTKKRIIFKVHIHHWLTVSLLLIGTSFDEPIPHSCIAVRDTS